MNEQLLVLIESYRNTQQSNLKWLTWIMGYVSVSSGIIELIRLTYNSQIPNVISFFSDPDRDIIFSIVMIILGLLIIFFIGKPKVYRALVFLLTCVWGWVGFSYLFSAIFITVNFKHILIVPILSQLMYMMKTSVFIDEIT